MGWRFRKSFSPLPGVRLTLSPRGFSTSVGLGPLRLTAGPQGTAVTARIPGTGIAYRETLIPSGQRKPAERPSFAPAPLDAPSPVITQPREEIASTGTSEMTTEGLTQFKELLTKARDERRALLPELKTATVESERLCRKYSKWERGWLFRRLFRSYFARLGTRAEEAKAKREELEEQERLSKLSTTIDLPDTVRKAFSRLSDAFVVMAKSEKIWDMTTMAVTDRARERTTAVHSVERKRVTFELGACDLIQSEWKVPHLMNANGGDLFIYPGFILYYVSADAFALVDTTQAGIASAMSPFIEEEGVPTDSRVIRQTWKKANKDGSPDRRFANNYQIPVVEYGGLLIKSTSGLNEAYLLSNAQATAQFSTCWDEFSRQLRTAASAEAH